ncbi:MAG: T9SS type A sorting domain-containing protein [Bacteroidetes bacterium]|nr:T9SS type A sorting domain-containing protein [Bacteroidota bacterium]
MKNNKIYLLLVITSLFTFKLNAQIQITSDDIIVKGIYKMATDTAPSISLGTPGASKTWDFSGVKKVFTHDNIILPYTDNGSGIDANFVLVEDGDSNVYFKKTSSTLFFMPGDAEENFKLTFMTFPFNYLSTSNDSVVETSVTTGDDMGFPLLDSVRVHFSIKYTSVCDAWGNVKTPVKTYESLRIKSDITTRFYAEGKIGNGNYTPIKDFGETDTEVQYIWLTKGGGFPVVTYRLGDNELEYIETSSLSSKEINKDNLKNVVVANPIGENLIIKNKGSENCEIIITDINGKTVLSATLHAGEEIKEDAAKLSNGIYIMNVKGKETNDTYNTKLIK